MIPKLISSGVFLLVVCVAIPILALLSKRKLDEGGWILRRLPFYGEAVAVQLVLLPIALWSASSNGIEISILGDLAPDDLFFGLLLLVLALGTMRVAWPRTSEIRRRRLFALVPLSGVERVAWVGVSLVAGIVEEIIYRGVLIGTLLVLFGDWWWAAVSSSVAFGMGHLMQGWKSAGTIMVFGFAFHLLVLRSGALLVAIAVHVLYDVIVGLGLGILLARDVGKAHVEAL